MSRCVTRHLGGKQPVPTNKKYVIRVLNDDHLLVIKLTRFSCNEVLHHAGCLVPTKRHTDHGVGGARRGHADSTRHCRQQVHALVTVAEINLGPPCPTLQHSSKALERWQLERSCFERAGVIEGLHINDELALC